MKRIALLRGAYFGPFEEQNFAPLLDRFDVHAYVLPQNRFDLKNTKVPVTVCRYPDGRFLGGRSLINAWKSRVLGQRYPMPGVGRIVKHADVVHTFEAWCAYTRQAAASSKQFGVPLVVTHWDTVSYRGRVPAALQSEIDQTHEIVRCFIAPTGAAKSALLQDGVPESKIVLQYMGVDVDRFAPAPADPALARRVGIMEDDFVFLYAGRLAPEKGLNVLIEAFSTRLQRSTTVRPKLLILGSGPEEPALRSAVERKGLHDSILFAPPVAYNELHLWYRLGNVFVLPSIPLSWAEEQFSYALVEAMACGLPVIATAVGGVPDVVGVAGQVVRPNDPGKLAHAMETLLSDRSEATRQSIAARARAVEQFCSRRVASSLADIYMSVSR